MKKPIGISSFYIKTDNKGFLTSDISGKEVQPDWKPAIKDFVKFIKSDYFENVHSIYLRGSVASKTAIRGISDIDFFIVTKNAATISEKENLWNKVRAVNSKYPFIKRFDIGFYTYTEILRVKERALIKLTSKCIYGKNVIPLIPKLKPGLDVAITLPSLEEEIKDPFSTLSSERLSKEEIKTMCIWLMKRLLRAGFELNSKRTQSFTRDLYGCWETFSSFYPQKKKDMYEILNLAIYPTADTSKIAKKLKGLGSWLIKEGKSQKLIT